MLNVKCPHCDQLFVVEIQPGTNGYDMCLKGWEEHPPELCAEYRNLDEVIINRLEYEFREAQ